MAPVSGACVVRVRKMTCSVCAKLSFRYLYLYILVYAGSGVFCGQLQAVTEDIFIFNVLVCLAHQRFATRMHCRNHI